MKLLEFKIFELVHPVTILSHQIMGVNPRARDEKAFPASYETPAMLLIVKSYRNIDGDRGKKVT